MKRGYSEISCDFCGNAQHSVIRDLRAHHRVLRFVQRNGKDWWGNCDVSGQKESDD
jgi:hypothetical protein